MPTKSQGQLLCLYPYSSHSAIYPTSEHVYYLLYSNSNDQCLSPPPPICNSVSVAYVDDWVKWPSKPKVHISGDKFTVFGFAVVLPYSGVCRCRNRLWTVFELAELAVVDNSRFAAEISAVCRSSRDVSISGLAAALLFPVIHQHGIILGTLAAEIAVSAITITTIITLETFSCMSQHASCFQVISGN